MPQNPRRRHAFTLIELLVVIAIIALLLGIVMPALNRAIRNAKRNKAHTETQNIATAVEMFDREYGYLPIPESQRGGRTSPTRATPPNRSLWSSWAKTRETLNGTT